MTKCPKCGEIATCDEVDIGVGTLDGNCACGNCGWIQSDELKYLITEINLS